MSEYLTTASIAAELARVTYKPGWVFTVYDGDWEGQHIAITTVVPDAGQAGETTTLDVHSALPPIPDAKYLHAWLMWRLARIETHEMREFYRLDGACVSDPHGANADRDNASYRPSRPTAKRVRPVVDHSLLGPPPSKKPDVVDQPATQGATAS